MNLFAFTLTNKSRCQGFGKINHALGLLSMQIVLVWRLVQLLVGPRSHLRLEASLMSYIL